MRHFSSHGIDIAFRGTGAGEPILLIHGFASNSVVNWYSTGWVSALVDDGRRVIAMDVRGHGGSAKLHDPAAYRPPLMAGDAANLLDHLAIPQADVMGYSMGGRIAACLALERPDLVRALVIGGMGRNLVDGVGGEDEIAAALEAPAGVPIADAVARNYRAFAERTGGDLKALAACMRGQREMIAAERLAHIRAPVLVAVGSDDATAGSAAGLAALISGAEAFDIAGRDHMRATGDNRFKAAVLDFLRRRP